MKQKTVPVEANITYYKDKVSSVVTGIIEILVDGQVVGTIPFYAPGGVNFYTSADSYKTFVLNDARV